MAVIRFTAVNRGELPSWLAAGATFYLANDFQGFPRRLVAKGERDETLNGTPEGWLDALQREYTIRTDFIPLYQRDLWRAFFTSVLNAEVFAIDFTARQLLGNPSFEAGNVVGWEVHPGGTALAATSAISAVGRYSGWVGLTTDVNTTVVISPPVPSPLAVSPGQSVLVQGIAKPDGGGSTPNRDLSLAPLIHDAGGSAIYSTAIGTAAFGTVAWQLLSGTATAPANSARLYADWFRSGAAAGTVGMWLFDEVLLSILSSWQNVWLVDDSIDEQQIGGVGVQYSFRVKVVP